MNRKLFALSLLGIMAFGAGPSFGQSSGCLKLLSGGILCPPPNGSLLTDQSGQFVCGPGQCARDSRGQVKCSSAPGGAVELDLKGNVVCVDGCVAASASICVTPRP